jgi:hypothetical protein
MFIRIVMATRTKSSDVVATNKQTFHHVVADRISSVFGYIRSVMRRFVNKFSLTKDGGVRHVDKEPDESSVCDDNERFPLDLQGYRRRFHCQKNDRRRSSSLRFVSSRTTAKTIRLIRTCSRYQPPTRLRYRLNSILLLS